MTSTKPAAIETGDRLAAILLTTNGVRGTSEALTQGSSTPEGVDHLLAEGALEKEDGGSTLLVGHEGRLSNLVTEVTGRRMRPVGHGGAIVLSYDSLAELLRGQARVEFRYPTVDHQEDNLQPKAQSKMTIASFFTGFVFAALIELLLRNPRKLPLRLAEVTLSLSLALFTACIYIYDELSMPEGFWTDGKRSRVSRTVAGKLEKRREDRWHRIAAKPKPDGGYDRADEDAAPLLLDGPLFVSMVETSKWIFTPAVILALAGFVAIVMSGTVLWVQGAAIAAVVVAAVIYRLRRPPLGPD